MFDSLESRITKTSRTDKTEKGKWRGERDYLSIYVYSWENKWRKEGLEEAQLCLQVHNIALQCK